MAATIPLVNGVNYAWSNVKLVLFGVTVTGVTKIAYKAKQKKDDNYGQGTYPISRGYGNYEFEGSITIYKDEWAAIIAAAPGRDPMQIPWFDVQVTYGGSRVTATCDTLKACEFLEDPLSVGQNDTKIMIDIPLKIALIEHTY